MAKRKITHQNHFVDSVKRKKPNGPIPHVKNNKPKGSKGSKGNDSSRNVTKKQAQQQYHQNQEPVIPFSSEDSILLIGEGDLSFAASLAAHHGCRSLTATVLEKNEKELLEKYPHAEENIAVITGSSKTKPSKSKDDGASDDAETSANGDHDSDDDEDDEDGDEEPRKPKQPNNNKVLYNIDVRTMKPFIKRTTTQTHHGTVSTTKTGLYKRIIFNFPHVGGKSTDRNRQVRYNQELLVSFFNSALPSLAPKGTIVVTLFEGDPYTLWNVKDLGRHAGLQAMQSFKFHSRAYPGYKHARTLGVVREKKTGEASGAAWKGEERPARSYVFMRKGDAPEALPAQKKKKKGRGGEESSSEEESDFEGEED